MKEFIDWAKMEVFKNTIASYLLLLMIATFITGYVIVTISAFTLGKSIIGALLFPGAPFIIIWNAYRGRDK